MIPCMQTIHITTATQAAEFGARLGAFAADLQSVDTRGIAMNLHYALASWRECEGVTFAPMTLPVVRRFFNAAMKASS